MAALHSDLEHLLKSNDPPHSSQTIRVRDIVRDNETVLSTLEDEISRLECTLQALRNKHADVAAEIARYNNILSPIRRLPTEIVGEIFLYFTPYLHRDTEMNLNTQVKLPWILGLICRLWRTISLSLGRLWCVLDLGPLPRRAYRAPQLVLGPDDDEAEFTELPPLAQISDTLGRNHGNKDLDEGYEIQTALNFIESCLQRSGRQPLFLRLWTDDFASLTLLDALSKSSAHWQELVLVEPSRALIDRVSTTVGDLQGLRKFSLSCKYRREFSFQPQAQSLRNITQLALVAVSIPLGSYTHIPWSQLTQYTEIDCLWGNGGDESARKRLASYRELTNLVVFCLETPELGSTDVPVLLPRLRVALFCSSGTVIESFDMPALEELSMDSNGSRLYIPTSSLCLKILRVRMHRSWSSSYPLMVAGDLERVLGLFADLTELSIDVPYGISDADISRLIPHNGQLPLAPKLHTIRISNWSFIDNSCKWTTLVDMLHARFRPTVQGVSRLRAFDFSTDLSAHDEHVVAGLRALRARYHWGIRAGYECQPPAWDERHSNNYSRLFENSALYELY
ncbi:hypothetical protein C8R47DRAFT_1321872 [Mycena vitilis]|nr:hypothetical protein C8R47DRAFT_1321872 [Mycena vitilis]